MKSRPIRSEFFLPTAHSRAENNGPRHALIVPQLLRANMRPEKLLLQIGCTSNSRCECATDGHVCPAFHISAYAAAPTGTGTDTLLTRTPRFTPSHLQRYSTVATVHHGTTHFPPEALGGYWPGNSHLCESLPRFSARKSRFEVTHVRQETKPLQFGTD